MKLFKRKLGPDAPEVSTIGFGCMPFSTEGRPENENDSIKVIHTVLDYGVTLLDTSNAYCIDETDYGHNERLISKALKTWSGNRDSIVVATKGGRTRLNGEWGINGHPDFLKKSCENSLKALDIERIELYHLNIPDPAIPFEDSIGALADLKKEGKIRWVGLSNVNTDEIDTARSIVDVVTVQNRCNIVFREDFENGVIDKCTDLGIGYLPFHPLGGWWLSKQLSKNRILIKIAKKYNASTYALILAWLIAKGPTIIPIPSSRSIEHALDSISSASTVLEEEDRIVIDKMNFSSNESYGSRVSGFIDRLFNKQAKRNY